MDDVGVTVHRAIRAVQGGDRNAFRAVVGAYERRLFSLCLALMRDAALAEELCQDAFVRAYANIEKYDTARPFYPWLATIAVRLGQTKLKQRTLERARAGEMVAEPASAAPDPLGLLVMDEHSRTLWQRVLGLSPAQRTAVFLFYREDMALTEVAAAMGVGAGTVKTLLYRARQALRGQMENEMMETKA